MYCRLVKIPGHNILKSENVNHTMFVSYGLPSKGVENRLLKHSGKNSKNHKNCWSQVLFLKYLVKIKTGKYYKGQKIWKKVVFKWNLS